MRDDMEKPISTEQRILAAAEHEFLEKGFSGARTSVIAEQAGVTHAMLHYYYRTKEKLFGRVLSDKLSSLAKIILIKFDENRPLDECIRGAVESHFDFICANPSLPRFMVCEVFPNPALLDIVREKIGEVSGSTIRALQKKIDNEASQGKCRWVDAMSMIIDIVSLNVFPILAIPMITRIGAEIREIDINKLLEMRREENVNTILRKIQL